MNGAHLHLILNHAPVFGTIAGLGLLVASLVIRNNTLLKAALVFFVLSAAAAGAAYLTGHAAEELTERLQGVAETAISQHSMAATLALATAVLLGAVAVAGLVAARRSRGTRSVLSIAALGLSIVTVGLMAWTANLGGRIHHPEISAAGTSVSSAAAAPTIPGATDRHGARGDVD